jgi:hypothetical protein
MYRGVKLGTTFRVGGHAGSGLGNIGQNPDGSVTATPDVHEDINAKVLYMCDCCFRYMCIMDLHAVHH